MRKRVRENKNLVVCPKNKQYTDIIVCAATCEYKRFCKVYREKITLKTLLEFIEKHPEYELVGELMAAEKAPKKKEQTFWVVTGENQYEEVTESEVMKNPQKYVDKKIWQKPPYRYEVVITLKRVKAD